MHIASTVFVVLVAIEHIYILILEMFLWTKPRGMKTFGNTQAQADGTVKLAKNQGLYNGFLAAGLLWSAVASDPRAALDLKTFFLGCVVVAGIYGGLTVSRRIMLVQATPAAIALALVWLAQLA